METICPKCKDADRPYFHCDICNGFGYIKVENKTTKNHTSKVATAIRKIRMMSGTRFPSAKTIKDVCKKHHLNEDNIRTIGGFKDSKGYQYVRD